VRLYKSCTYLYSHKFCRTLLQKHLPGCTFDLEAPVPIWTKITVTTTDPVAISHTSRLFKKGSVLAAHTTGHRLCLIVDVVIFGVCLSFSIATRHIGGGARWTLPRLQEMRCLT